MISIKKTHGCKLIARLSAYASNTGQSLVMKIQTWTDVDVRMFPLPTRSILTISCCKYFWAVCWTHDGIVAENNNVCGFWSGFPKNIHIPRPPIDCTTGDVHLGHNKESHLDSTTNCWILIGSICLLIIYTQLLNNDTVWVPNKNGHVTSGEKMTRRASWMRRQVTWSMISWGEHDWMERLGAWWDYVSTCME